MKIAISLAALLAACCQQSAPPTANKVSEPAPIAKPAVPAAKAFVYDEKIDLIEYHYAWSAEAAAVPQLAERFRAAMDKDKAELLANVRKDKASLVKVGYAFTPWTDYATAGQSPRLLSLSVDVRSYPGGAGTGKLLWDRQAARQITVADLFATPASMDRLLTQRWCDALNEAREKRRKAASGGGMFDNDLVRCPQLIYIAIVPTDKNKNGRFERLILTASSRVEDSYKIDLAVTPDLIAALKADYRDSFEVGQPQ